ncbi:MAG: aminotransferase class I/II-fold pyridoxal phosphate-dependent enzyme, partial [Candidatus Latescibacteria bacterium]|nr:aminotransferase class I/II-fold pyridoxal phosphate-dependent enzyme [Candidatus Latescibacterota bacterium]
MKEPKIESDQSTNHGSVSRRDFLMGALVSTGAFAAGDIWQASAASSTTSLLQSVADIKSRGVPPGEIRLNNNENPMGVSLRVIDTVLQILFSVNRFDSSSELNKVISRFHGVSPGGRGRSDQRVIIAPGSDAIHQIVARLALNGGTGEVIEATPAYGRVSAAYEAIRMADGHLNSGVKRIPIGPDHTHDLAAMLAAITSETSCIVITNPNNPTGTIVPHEELGAFLDAVPDHVTVMIDEAYMDFVQVPGYKDAIQLAHGRENIIVTRTFSKVYGLAAVRIGYAVTSVAMADRLSAVNDFGETVSLLSKAAALAAIEDTEFVRRTIESVSTEKAYLIGQLEAMGIGYIPSHTNFLMIDLKRDSGPVRRQLEQKK